jgi:hypothetical protein
LDRAVTELGHHILAFPWRAYPELADLAAACWKMLDAADLGLRLRM